MCGLVVKNNDTDYTVDDEVALANSGWSLLKTVQLDANNKRVKELLQHASVAFSLSRPLMTVGAAASRTKGKKNK